jgi:hypothetical protein
LLERHLSNLENRPITKTLQFGNTVATDDLSQHWNRSLPLLAKPWGVHFGLSYLAAFREYLRRAQAVQSLSPGSWMGTLGIAGLALPPDCFAVALEDWPLSESDDWLWRRWHQAVRDFKETIRTRQRLMEEIPL